jgi:hypothetical protein
MFFFLLTRASFRPGGARGRRVVYAEEASRGIDEARIAACSAAWREAGVRFATLDELTAEL